MAFPKMNWFSCLKTIRILTKKVNKTNNFDIDFWDGEIGRGDCILEENPWLCFQMVFYALYVINIDIIHESAYFEWFKVNCLV